MPILTHQQDELLWLSSTLLEAQPHLRHGFSTRKGGVSQPPWYSLNLGIGRDDNPEHVRENYRRFCGALGMDHIDAMDDLKRGIRLRAYAQTDPVVAYKQESLTMFEEMISAIQGDTVRRLFSIQLKKDQEIKRERVAKGIVEGVGGDGSRPKRQPRKVVKIGRNDPCPCGSGKKYKVCCGREG